MTEKENVEKAANDLSMAILEPKDCDDEKDSIAKAAWDLSMAIMNNIMKGD